jgi:hypothetical protein
VQAQNTATSLKDALQQKKIKVTCKGNDQSVHYLKPLAIVLTNLENLARQIEIPAGSFFASEPAEFQDITITETQLIVLKPLESKTIEISGVCSEAGNSAPGAKANYTLTTAPKPEYVVYAQYIDKQKFYGTYEAQAGMWSLSDGHDWLIDGHTDGIGKMGLRISYQVAKLKGLSVPFLTEDGEIKEIIQEFDVLENGKIVKKKHKVTPKQPEPENTVHGQVVFHVLRQGKPTKITHIVTRRNPEPDSVIIAEKDFEMVENGKKITKKHYITKELPEPLGEIVFGQKDYKVTVNNKEFSTYTRLITNQNPEPKCEMSGNATVRLSRAAKVRMGMFDDKGVLIREIYYKDNEKPGQYFIQYAYDCDRYQEDVYHFKIIKDDRIALTMTMRNKK